MYEVNGELSSAQINCSDFIEPLTIIYNQVLPENECLLGYWTKEVITP